MAGTWVQVANDQGSTGNTPATSAAGSGAAGGSSPALVAVGVAMNRAAGSPPGTFLLSDNLGSNFRQLTPYVASADGKMLEAIFVVPKVTPGAAYTVTATTGDGQVADISFGVGIYTGGDTGLDVLDSVMSAVGTGTTADSGAVPYNSTLAANELFLGLVSFQGNAGVITVGGGFELATRIQGVNAAINLVLEDNAPGATVATDATATCTNPVPWTALGVSLFASSDGRIKIGRQSMELVYPGYP